MRGTIIKYGVAMAAGVFALQWMEYQYTIRTLPTEGYIVVIAVLFTALGIWVGKRLTSRELAKPFEKNLQAIKYLGISEREYQVLELLARGHSNEQIAKGLFVSPNTVKTHLASLYGKLEVTRRTLAIQKARTLQLIP